MDEAQRMVASYRVDAMKWHILLVGLAWMGASVVALAQTAKPSAEAKLIADLYGKRIAKVQASSDKTDDVALSREILLAAADSVNPTGLRYLLAMEALKLSTPVGSEEAAKLARESLGLADQLKPLKPIEKCRFEIEIAARRHEFARRKRVSAKDRIPLAKAVVEADIALAKALMQARQAKQAGAVLAAAYSKARKYKLPDQQADIKALMEAMKAFNARLARIRILDARLKRALKENDDDTAKASRQSLGLIYLLIDGDIPKAETYLSGTGHKYESAVAAAAAFLKDPQKIPPAAACNEVIESLGAAAKSAGNRQARIRIATPAMNLCRGLLAGKPTGLSAAKTRLLLAEMERLAEDSPADRFIRKLKANYKDLAGKIEVLNLKEGIVRVTYDFSRRKQLDDWRARNGTWTVSGKKKALIATPTEDRWTGLASRLRFRADKPLTFTFRARGRESLAGALALQWENDPQRRRHWLYCKLGGGNYYSSNSVSYLYDGDHRVWSDKRFKVARNTTYRFKIAWDGQKFLTWTVNDKVFCKHGVRYRKDDLPFTSVFVRLETTRHPAGFDDVTLEGAILKDPSKRLPGPERRRRHRP